jgi:exosortase/archaeosortase family protein
MTAALTTQNLYRQWKKSLTTFHGRMLNLAGLAGLLYFPLWFGSMWRSVLDGNSTLILNGAFLFMGLRTLWGDRREIAELAASGDDRFAGHLLILGGAFWLPFSQHSVSLQALLWVIVLVGVFWSSFGLRVFVRHGGAIFFLLLSMYPSLYFVGNRLLHSFVSYDFFRDNMAQLGGKALNIMGFANTVSGNLIHIDGNVMRVEYSCTGTDMLISLAGFGLVVGLLFKQPWTRIAIAMVLGAAIAMVLNVPRVVLLSLADTYWGKNHFDFWHGTWGGQIFSMIMFTVAYYAFEALYGLKGKPKKGKVKKRKSKQTAAAVAPSTADSPEESSQEEPSNL